MQLRAKQWPLAWIAQLMKQAALTQSHRDCCKALALWGVSEITLTPGGRRTAPFLRWHPLGGTGPLLWFALEFVNLLPPCWGSSASSGRQQKLLVTSNACPSFAQRTDSLVEFTTTSGWLQENSSCGSTASWAFLRAVHIWHPQGSSDKYIILFPSNREPWGLA